MAYADQRDLDGEERWRPRKIDARLATIEDDLDSGAIGGGGPATSLDTTGAAVDVSASAPPTTGQVLTATSATSATWQTPASNGLWTYAFLAADHTNTTTTPTDVAGLAFTPAASKRYEIEGRFFVRAAATTTGAQIGVVWPTGIVAPSAAHLGSPASSTALTLANVTRGTTGAANATGVPSTTLEALGLLTAILTTGASPSGTFKIQLDSEVAASEARMLAGSFIRYREIPTS